MIVFALLELAGTGLCSYSNHAPSVGVASDAEVGVASDGEDEVCCYTMLCDDDTIFRLSKM